MDKLPLLNPPDCLDRPTHPQQSGESGTPGTSNAPLSSQPEAQRWHTATKEQRYSKIRDVFANELADVRYRIESMFRDAAIRLEDSERLHWLEIDRPLLHATFIHPNDNGSLDAEFHIAKIPHNVPIKKVLIILSSVLQPVADTFNTTGMLFSPADDSEPSLRLPSFRGINCVTTQFEKTRTCIGSIITARDLARRTLEKARRKPAVVMVNFHWNAIDERPSRNRRPTVCLMAKSLIDLSAEISVIYRKLMSYKRQNRLPALIQKN